MADESMCTQQQVKKGTVADDPQVFELRCSIQQYDWGKLGLDSEVAALKASADPDFKVDPKKTYAELWMGTHPNGPATVVRPGHKDVPLLDWVRDHPDCLGSEVKDYFKGDLPFLFKVLSVRTSLSIQAHPNKVHAEELHKKFPNTYKDANHKPEMAIALTPFLALCGFRPVQEVAYFLQHVHELKAVVGTKNVLKLVATSHGSDMPSWREAMKDCFTALMEAANTHTVKDELRNLVERIHTMQANGEDLKPLEGEIILKLNAEFPGDAGVFCVYFLNVVHLQPGEAMFLEANLPHAYLSGDCMECMACSDNVVRAGLTPKMIDKHTLVEMLDYSCRNVSASKFCGMQTSHHITTTIFRPPVPDFGVTKFEVPEEVKDFTLNAFESASICIVVSGEGHAISATLHTPLPLRRGSVFFVAAQQEVKIMLTGSQGMLLFQAYAGLL